MGTCLRLATPQVLAERCREALLSLLVFGVHLRHMAIAIRSCKRVDGRKGGRHRRALPNKLLP